MANTGSATPSGVAAIRASRLPNNLEDLLRSIAWTTVTLGQALQVRGSSMLPSTEETLPGPIHLAALALRLTKNEGLSNSVIAVGYLDPLKTGVIAISNLPQGLFPRDYVAICRLSFGWAEACNDPSDIGMWGSIIGGKDLIVLSLTTDILLERLKKEGKLVK